MYIDELANNKGMANQNKNLAQEARDAFSNEVGIDKANVINGYIEVSEYQGATSTREEIKFHQTCRKNSNHGVLTISACYPLPS